MLLQQGVPARVAMQILGHSQISLTLGTYSHVVPELATEAASRMGVVLWVSISGTRATSADRYVGDMIVSECGGGAGGARTHDRRIMSPLL